LQFPIVLVSDVNRPGVLRHLAVQTTQDQIAKVFDVNEVLYLPATAQSRHESRVLHLFRQPAKNPTGTLAIYQPGPNHADASGLGNPLDLQLGSAIKRATSFKRAERGNQNNQLHPSLTGGLK